MGFKLLFLALCIPIVFLAACSSNNHTQNEQETSSSNENLSTDEKEEVSQITSEEGYIVKKFDDSKLWVIPEMTTAEITGKDQKELDDLLNKKYEGKGFHFSVDDIDEETLSSLQVGQKVKVTFDKYGHSAPMAAHATDIEITEEQ